MILPALKKFCARPDRIPDDGADTFADAHRRNKKSKVGNSYERAKYPATSGASFDDLR